MKRKSQSDLESWLKSRKRKPLVLRGARQVGKSTLVRQFAKEQGLSLFEVNLEQTPVLKNSFTSLNPKKVLTDLSLVLGRKFSLSHDLLFLDEIQAIPEAFACLRYFYEQLPEAKVIAAGSLLDVLVTEQTFSLPVGRVDFFHLGPMSFQEFLLAMDQEQLIEIMHAFKWGGDFSEVAHNKLADLYWDYLYVGGMPEAVAEYKETQDMNVVRKIQHSILDTYRADFGKYRRSVPQLRLERAFDYASQTPCKKVRYSEISREDQSRELKIAIDLLERARVLTRVFHTNYTASPLKNGMSEKVFKFIFLDVGLTHASKNLSLVGRLNKGRIENQQLGQMAEQFVGQHLIQRGPSYTRSEIYYWLREGRSNNAEVDYLLPWADSCLPVEVKSGKAGSMKSLFQFISQNKIRKALRLDMNPPSRSKHLAADLFSLPVYMIEEIERLC